MNPENNITYTGTGYLGTIYSLFAVIISMLPELDIWFRLLASISAIIAAWTSIYVMIAKFKKDKSK